MAERKRSLAFDRVADSYDATRGGVDRGRVVAGALAPLLPTGRVLEIGVGTGVVAAALRAAGRDVVGIDLSRPMLEHAAGRLGPRVAQADAQALPIRNGAVAAAYLVWVLHLVADVGLVLADVARVVRPGGQCLVVPSNSGRDPGTDAESDVEALLDQMFRELQPAGRADAVHRVRDAAASTSLRYARRAEFAVGPIPLSPQEVAQRIVERSYSVLWEIPDEVWVEVVRPLLARLRSLPEPDRPRRTGNRYDVLVFDR